MSLLEKCADTGVFDPEITVLGKLLRKKLKQPVKADDQTDALSVRLSSSISNLPAIIEADLAHQQYDDAELHIQKYLQRYPDSVVGRILWAKMLFARGKFSEAVTPLSQLSNLFPEESYFSKNLIEIEVRKGNYGKGLTLLQKNGGMKSGDTTISGPESTENIEELLILARLLWGDKQHEKSLQVYRKLLSPSTLELLNEKFRQKQMNYLYLAREKTLWSSMLALLQSEPGIIAELMGPAFLGENFTHETGKIVAEHYELYSWQKLIGTEYLARKASFEKNYPYAEVSYKRLVDEQPGAPEGMIDLAAIYGRIGKYRKEAQVYEAIQNSGTTSPELVNSMERNSLQLSPQNIFDTTFFSKDGRHGYIDLETFRVGSSFWFTPDLDTDIRLTYSNNRYQSAHTSTSTGSNLLYGTATYEFAKDYELVLGGGTEKMDGTSDAFIIRKITLQGQLDEYFHTYLNWGKSLVDDTVMALKEGITQQEIEAGLYCETPQGLIFGSDFRHRSYSDTNTQNKFRGYTSYGIFGDSMQLSLRYDYQFLKNTLTNQSGPQISEDHPQDILLYWSPASFSENLFTLHFQHDFLGYQQGGKRKNSYYALDNSIGYDDLETLSYSGKFDIFLEMNPHFLLKGNVTFTKSEVLEEKGLYFSLHYRW